MERTAERKNREAFAEALIGEPPVWITFNDLRNARARVIDEMLRKMVENKVLKALE